MKSLTRIVPILVLLATPVAALAEFLDCLSFDGFDGEAAAAPAAWKNAVDLHNCARKTVVPAAVPPIPLLRWSSSLATAAQDYANECVWAHSGAAGLGENLYAAAPWSAAETAAATNWASESDSYSYADNRCASGASCGHYTQMVWRSTDEFGCGINDCSTGSPFAGFPQWTIVVCNYTPPGNFNGQRPY